MFFFFFVQLYEILVIKRAFQKVCLNKMLSDGYFDMSMYIFARIKKEDMLLALITSKSPYVKELIIDAHYRLSYNYIEYTYKILFCKRYTSALKKEKNE